MTLCDGSGPASDEPDGAVRLKTRLVLHQCSLGLLQPIHGPAVSGPDDLSGALPPGSVRLNRYLAGLGVASRRRSDEMIVAGRVALDGAIVREPWTQVVPGASAMGAPPASR